MSFTYTHLAGISLKYDGLELRCYLVVEYIETQKGI